jgi:signal transduction histidine kinase/ActR/RegA family two-component response regulator
VHGLEAGADGYLTHPVEPPVLIATVHAFLRTRQAESIRVKYEEEREALLRSERIARAEAEEANRLKDDFLATLSHELRTPLSAIVGWSSVLRLGVSDAAELAEGLEAIERNAMAQSQLIGDLLDISRITTGKIRLDLQLLDPSTVVESALSAILPIANQKGIKVAKECSANAGPIQGDPARMQQVLWNLINNAVKFTLQGGKVFISVVRSGDRVEMRVQDTGEGIAPDLLPMIFDRFRQGDSSITREHGGLGLGLAIAKQLVELHGGTISAESAGLGLGTTFLVSLPIATSSRSSASMPVIEEEAASPQTDAVDLQGLRILLVDDDADSRALVRRFVTHSGAEILECGSAAEALTNIGDFHPHLLISDLGMPQMDGYALIREIRTRGLSYQDLPAIALTAFARPEDRRRCLLAGFQMHLPKPVDPRELVASIASIVGRIGL